MRRNLSIYFVLLVCAVIAVSMFDGTVSSLVAELFILSVGTLLCQTVNSSLRSGAYRTLFVVSMVYFIVAYIFSLSFDQNNFFCVSDSMRYLQYYQDSIEYFQGWDFLNDTYLGLSDNNGLYNSYIQFWCAFGNINLRGASVYYVTLAQTLFGIMSSIVLYRIIARRYPNDAAKYTITFSCCSLVLFYSSVIIRDVAILPFFLYALDYLTHKFKLYRLILLFLFAFAVWGIRLYSGLFYFIFPFSYTIFWIIGRTRKHVTILLFMLLFLFLLPVVVTSSVGEQTQAELETYEILSSERNENGLFNKLSKLPIGLKQLSLTLFSQISPFPPYQHIQKSSNFSEFIMGLDSFIYEIYWFFIVFMFAYLAVFKNRLKILSREELLLVLIAVLYIIANTAHPDIRRMMPVYPILYMGYLKLINSCPIEEIINTKNKLKLLYCILFIFAFYYRG